MRWKVSFKNNNTIQCVEFYADRFAHAVDRVNMAISVSGYKGECEIIELKLV